jgi:hypothetical protein
MTLLNRPEASNNVRSETLRATGDLSEAISLNDDILIDDTDPLEENCRSFYQLYANYQQLAGDSSYAATDSTALFYLANLCPASDGPCVYQARALINTIYQFSPNFSDCDEGTGARAGVITSSNSTNSEQAFSDLYNVFPNPAGNEIKILSKYRISELQIEIKDLVGRIVLSTKLKPVGNLATLIFDLPNGAYLLKISDNNYDETTKKLLISR